MPLDPAALLFALQQHQRGGDVKSSPTAAAVVSPLQMALNAVTLQRLVG